jgi:hypothetical protein
MTQRKVRHFLQLGPLDSGRAKGTERAIAHLRQSFVYIAGLEPRCILLIGRLRGISPWVQTGLHTRWSHATQQLSYWPLHALRPIFSARRRPLGTPLAAWRDDGCNTRIPVGVPFAFSSVGPQLRQALTTFAAQGSPQLCSTFSRWRFSSFQLGRGARVKG